MPHSDNLYAALDSADSPDSPDSNADADQHVLSPSDGYFASSASARVPNLMVADPGVERDEADAKAREAAQQASSASRQYYTTSQSSSSSSPPATTTSVPRSTLIHARPPSVYSEAPPAYSPSASSPASPTSPLNNTTTSTSYNTFSATTMGSSRETEHDPLLGRRTLQNMGGRPADEEAGVSRPWRIDNSNKIRSRLPSWQRKWKAIVGGMILLAVALAFIVSSAQDSNDDVSGPLHSHNLAQYLNIVN